MQDTSSPYAGGFRYCSQGGVQDRSTLCPRDHRVRQGETYPVVHVQISSASHRSAADVARDIDTEGRVERFRGQTRKEGTTS